MGAEQLRNLVRCRPFKPFILHLSDGTQYVVRHPELVLLTYDTVFFGDDAKSKDGIARGVQILAMNHIVRVEFVEDATAAAT